MKDERIPVEPLSEKRWQQIRKNVIEQAAQLDGAAVTEPPEPSRRGMVAFGTGAALVAAAACALWMTQPPTTTSVATSRVVTNTDSATMTAGDVSVEVAAHTSVLAMEREPDAWTVSLENGSAHFVVPPRGDRPHFVVEAGRTRVEVIGTAFTVTRAPGAPSASVSVDHGVVRVSDGDVLVVLHDAERWPETVATSTSPSTATALAPPPATALAPPPATATTLAPPPATALAPPSTSTALTARDRYRAAEALETRDPTAALAAYAEIERDGGAWSAPALMSEARLEAELHHDARARELAERYLSDHPDGINAEDARELLRRLR